jgi:hypothetical protein
MTDQYTLEDPATKSADITPVEQYLPGSGRTRRWHRKPTTARILIAAPHSARSVGPSSTFGSCSSYSGDASSGSDPAGPA